MEVYIEMPLDIGTSTRLKLNLRSGGRAELGVSGDAQGAAGQVGSAELPA